MTKEKSVAMGLCLSSPLSTGLADWSVGERSGSRSGFFDLDTTDSLARSFVVGAVLCTVGCLAASLASTPALVNPTCEMAGCV